MAGKTKDMKTLTIEHFIKMKHFNKMGTFLLDVFKQYNWRKVVVISSNFFLWLDAGKAIRKVQNINVT